MYKTKYISVWPFYIALVLATEPMPVLKKKKKDDINFSFGNVKSHIKNRFWGKKIHGREYNDDLNSKNNANCPHVSIFEI